MLLQKQCTRTSKAIVRREKSASNVHQGRSSLVELENPATEHSDAFSAFLPPTTLPLDDDPIKTVISVKTMQSLLRTLFSTPILVLVPNVNCQSNGQKLSVIGCHWKEEVVRLIVQTSLIGTSIKQPIWSRPHPQLFPSPPAIVLQVEESWTNLSTMRASQAPLSSPDPKFPQPTPKSQIAASVARIAAKSAHNAGAQAEARRRWSTLEEVSSQARL